MCHCFVCFQKDVKKFFISLNFFKFNRRKGLDPYPNTMYLDPQHWPRPNISSTVTGTPQEPDYCHRVCHGHLHSLVLQGEQG